MKNTILFLFMFALLVMSCEKEDGKRALNDKVTITGVNAYAGSKALSDTPEGIMGTDITDSLKFIAKYAESFNFLSLDGETKWGATSFGASQENYDNRHDTINNKLLYEGGQVITSRGTLGQFIVDCQDACFYVYIDEAKNVIFPIDFPTNPDWDPARVDTVAYIPNAVLNKARVEIMDAFAREDYEACYRLFDEAFVFVPTTGAKWRALKAAGIE